ncbi:MAG: hypothetical protein NTY65_01860 [Planctomycetota bacterium]|nr:hypothetical protein [Planctomycetota bacterium]
MSEHELAELDDDGGELLETVPLSPKELAFCEAFGNPESETFGSARKSAEAAGYVQAHNAGWKLRRRPRIIAKLAEFEKVVRVQIGKVLTDLEFTRLQALTKGDLATAARCSELQGKHLAMFTDAVFVDNSAVVERYDARRAEQAERITTLLLTQQVTGQGPLQIPAALVAGQEPQAPRTRQESE